MNAFKLHYDGKISRSKGIMWYLEDPASLINRTADPGLREPKKIPWIRIYGPFKNSRLADWTIFYGSFIFTQLYNINNLLGWWEEFLELAFIKFGLIDTGIIIFLRAGRIMEKEASIHLCWHFD